MLQFHTKFTFLFQDKTVGHEGQESRRGEIGKVRHWDIIGVGSGWGARNMGTAEGPKVLMEAIPSSFQKFSQTFTYWHGKDPLCFSNPVPLPGPQAKVHADHVLEMASWLSSQTKASLQQGNIPLVLGGDHSIAIGTWSGVKAALGEEDMGLIWIDAHMDAHTTESSPSSNVHGMPVAVLLGQGEQRFTHFEKIYPKIKPENICLIGIRSFEEGEAALLRRLGVQIYSIQDVQEKGFSALFQEARRKFSARRFGLSIDVDAFDPEEAPGTGTPEDFGLRFNDVKEALYGLANHPDFLALEITEFNPYRDINNKTCQLVWQLATLIAGDIDGEK